MDIELLPTGDFQTGSTTALHPNIRRDKSGKYVPLTTLGGWYYAENPRYYPSSLQVGIWNHYEKCLDLVAKSRKGKRLFFLKMGDDIDGVHHNTPQLITRDITEQVNTHIEIMEYTKKRIGFQRGDTLACLQGTEVHVGKMEQEIGRQIGAIEHEFGVYASPFIEVELNGVKIWAYHKGVSAGQGHLRGNAQVNKMRQVYYQCLQDGEKAPDLIITAHTHDQNHSTWTRPDGKTMHYLITASWQDKTRFVFDNLATNRNKVGLQTITITDSGKIIVNPPMLLASPRGHSMKVK